MSDSSTQVDRLIFLSFPSTVISRVLKEFFPFHLKIQIISINPCVECQNNAIGFRNIELQILHLINPIWLILNFHSDYCL